MIPESKLCDWCGKDIDDDVFKLYNGMRLHVKCYEEYKDQEVLPYEEED